MVAKCFRIHGLIREKQRPLRTQINRHARLVLQFANKFGIHRRAGGRQFMQSLRHLKGEVGQHSTRRPRGFAAGLTLFNYQDLEPFLVQLDRKRKSNDASPDDDYVVIPHTYILAAR